MTLVLPLLVFGAPAAGAESSLAADAGTSVLVAQGDAIAASGRAFFGTAPYAFAWTLVGGDASRFADAGSASTTFDTTGLPEGDVVLELTVTDAAGASATDTVRHHVGASEPFVVKRQGSVPVGVPDEVVGLSVDGRVQSFEVPEGVTSLAVVLDWMGPLHDFDIEVLRPDGTSATHDAGRTGDKPEVLHISGVSAGTWRAKIEPFLVTSDTYSLTITGAGGAGGTFSMLEAWAGGPGEFGVTDEQTVHAWADRGVAPYAFAWDLDGDGWFESAGQRVTPHFPVGEHVARVRATDAAGFEIDAQTTLTVFPEDVALRMRCGLDGERPYWMMEFSASRGTCWLHGGHHTYFFGGPTYVLRSFKGYAFSVEQQFSPPQDVLENVLQTPIHVEVSVDGQEWTPLQSGRYKFLGLGAHGGTIGAPSRQVVALEGEGAGEEFRYLRVHQPRSLAHGLSGFLDDTRLLVRADVLAPAAEPALAPGTRTLDCASGDLMEDFFPEHPCWFGGVNRYDAPSFFHTYVAGDGARLDRIEGAFTLLPWRTDDWKQGTPVAPEWSETYAFVQTSVDGIAWTDVAIVHARYGLEQKFTIVLDEHDARFVRLFPAYHARYDQAGQFAPNHHPEGYFVDSRVSLTGLLPEA